MTWFDNAQDMAREGYGWEDIAIKYKLRKDEAWRIVSTFGGRHEDPRLNRQIEPIGRLVALFGRGRGTKGVETE
jgi:hypothetical protein